MISQEELEARAIYIAQERYVRERLIADLDDAQRAWLNTKSEEFYHSLADVLSPYEMTATYE
jgi:uncharacterized protein HemX